MSPSSELPLDNQCIYCGTEFSPFWWPPDALGGNADALVSRIEEDVKMASEEVSQVNHQTNSAEDSDVVMVEETTKDTEAEKEVTSKSLHRKICHSCYFQRSQEQDKPIVLDFSTPIAVL